MTSIRGPLARLERSRDELAKAWLVRLIERASLEEIRDLPTELIARDLPDLISDLLLSLGSDGGGAFELSDEQVQRAAALATVRLGGEASAAELSRDVAALEQVLLHALREEFADGDPEGFAEAVERLAEVSGAV